MLENALNCLSTQLDEKLNLSTSGVEKTCKGQENIDPNVQQRDDLLSVAQLKKEVRSNKSRRTRTWIDKLHKEKRKNPKSAIPAKKIVNVYHMQAAHLCMLL